MQQVKSLDIYACTFGPLSLKALRPHFHILRQLRLEDATWTTPSIIPEVLTSCPQLEILVAGEVTTQEILRGQPWACEHTLKTLHLCILNSPDQDVDNQQELAFERISRLHHLEELGLLYGVSRQENTHISLQLGRGLEHLSTLKRLRHLRLNSISHRMTETDVRVIGPGCNFVSLMSIAIECCS